MTLKPFKYIALTLIYTLFFSLLSFLLVLGWFATHPVALLPHLNPLLDNALGLMIKVDHMVIRHHKFRSFYFYAENLRVHPGGEAPPLFISREISLLLKVESLAPPHLVIEHLRLEQLETELAFDEQNNLTFGGFALFNMLPESAASSSQGSNSRVKITPKRLAVLDSSLVFNFPESTSMPPVQLSSIHVELALDALPLVAGSGKDTLLEALGSRQALSLSSKLEWSRLTGAIHANMRQTQQGWQGSYRLTGIPIHMLRIPDQEDIFPAMPLHGWFNLMGTYDTPDLKTFHSQANWRLDEGIIYTPRFTDGKMEVGEFRGTLSAKINPKDGVRVDVSARDVEVAFGLLHSDLYFELPPNQTPVLGLKAWSQDWDYRIFGGYLNGWVPPGVGDWVTTHITQAIVSKVEFDMRLLLKDFVDHNEVLQMTLRTEITEATLNPFRNFPEVTGGKGVLTMKENWITIDFEAGQFDGAKLDQGQLRIGYALPEFTPLILTIDGQAQAEDAWPALRPMLAENIDWVAKLEVSGPAKVHFRLEDKDLGGESEASLLTQIDSQRINLAWQLESGYLHANEVIVGMDITLEDIHFRQVHWNLGPFDIQGQGLLHYDELKPTNLTFQVEGLESLLPQYDLKSHSMNSWLPKRLKLKGALVREEAEILANPFWLHLNLLDDQQHQLKTSTPLDGQWNFSVIKGRFGQYNVNAALDLTDRRGRLNLQQYPEKPHGLSLALDWQQDRAELKAQMHSWALRDWTHWSFPPLPKELSQILTPFNAPKQQSQPPWKALPIRHWKFEIGTQQASFLAYRDTNFFVAGKAHLDDQINLELSALEVGSLLGTMTFKGTPQKARVWFDSNELDFLRWWRFFNQPQTQEEQTDQDAESNAQLDYRIEFAFNRFKFPHKPESPLVGVLHLNQVGQNTFLKADLDYEIDRIQTEVSLRPDEVRVQVQKQRLDLPQWFRIINTLQRSTSPAPPESNKPLPTIDFEVKVNELRFSPKLVASTHLKGYFAPDPKQRGSGNLMFERFQWDLYEGWGVVRLDPNHQQVNFQFDQLNLPHFVSMFDGIDWAAWSQPLSEMGQDDPLPENSATEINRLDLNLKVKNAHLGYGRNLPLEAESSMLIHPAGAIQVSVPKLHWGQQHMKAEVEISGERVKVASHIDFLELQLLKTFTSELQTHNNLEQAAEPEAPEQEPLQDAKKLAFAIPKLDLDADITIDRLKFPVTTYQQFRFVGQMDDKSIRVPQYSWKKGTETVFSLSAFLRNTEPTRWRGTVTAEILELAEVSDFFLRTEEEPSMSYNIEDGRTHLQGDVVLTATDDGKWIPRVQVTANSEDGIIKRGKSLVVLLATISINSYFQAFQGRLSGFEGKGLVFNRMSTNLIQTGGLFEVQDFFLDSPTMRMVGSGVIDSLKEEHNLLFCLQPFGTLDDVLQNIPIINWFLTSSRGALFEACFRSSGSLENPQILPIPFSLLPGRLRDLLVWDYKAEDGEPTVPTATEDDE